MKIKKSALCLIVAVSVFAGLIAGVGAAGTLQTITAYLNPNISVEFDGKEQELLDANGDRVYPIVYADTTYLPVRTVANMLNIDVGWDQDTQTVLLGKSAHATTNLIDAFEPYYVWPNSGYVWTIQSTAGKSETIGGVTTDNWIHLHGGDIFAYVGEGDGDLTCSYNIGGKYSNLSFKAYSEKDITLAVYGDDDMLLGKYEITGGKVPQTYNIKLFNTQQVSFVRIDTSRDYGHVKFNTFIFDAELT